MSCHLKTSNKIVHSEVGLGTVPALGPGSSLFENSSRTFLVTEKVAKIRTKLKKPLSPWNKVLKSSTRLERSASQKSSGRPKNGPKIFLFSKTFFPVFSGTFSWRAEIIYSSVKMKKPLRVKKGSWKRTKIEFNLEGRLRSRRLF